MNALKHGMSAKVAVLPHECAPDYDEMRASLIESYQPANAAEHMLVDQIVVGYWRRAKNFDRLLVSFRCAGASYVTTSLLQSQSQLRALLPVPPARESDREAPADGPAGSSTEAPSAGA